MKGLNERIGKYLHIASERERRKQSNIEFENTIDGHKSHDWGGA